MFVYVGVFLPVLFDNLVATCCPFVKRVEKLLINCKSELNIDLNTHNCCCKNEQLLGDVFKFVWACPRETSFWGVEHHVDEHSDGRMLEVSRFSLF